MYHLCSMQPSYCPYPLLPNIGLLTYIQREITYTMSTPGLHTCDAIICAGSLPRRHYGPRGRFHSGSPWAGTVISPRARRGPEREKCPVA